MTKKIGHLHVLTDETVQNRFSHAELAKLAVAGGADSIQFRDKHRHTSSLVEIAAAIREICHRANVPLIINDRTDVALAVDADGVHLGQRDLPISVMRELLGPGVIIGGSASTLEEALAVQRAGADYVGFGHIYETTSKTKKGAPKGLETLRNICGTLTIPVIAIGGIDRSNFGPVLEAGAWGIAVIAAVCVKEDPVRATGELRKGIDSHFEKKG